MRGQHPVPAVRRATRSWYPVVAGECDVGRYPVVRRRTPPGGEWRRQCRTGAISRRRHLSRRVGMDRLARDSFDDDDDNADDIDALNCQLSAAAAGGVVDDCRTLTRRRMFQSPVAAGQLPASQ